MIDVENVLANYEGPNKPVIVLVLDAINAVMHENLTMRQEVDRLSDRLILVEKNWE